MKYLIDTLILLIEITAAWLILLVIPPKNLREPRRLVGYIALWAWALLLAFFIYNLVTKHTFF